MKKLIFIPTMLLILLSMTIQAQSKFELNPNGDKDQAVVRSYFNAMTSMNSAQLEQTHGSNYVGYGPRWDSPQSREGMLQNVKNIWDFYDNIRYDRIRIISVNVSKDVGYTFETRKQLKQDLITKYRTKRH